MYVRNATIIANEKCGLANSRSMSCTHFVFLLFLLLVVFFLFRFSIQTTVNCYFLLLFAMITLLHIISLDRFVFDHCNKVYYNYQHDYYNQLLLQLLFDICTRYIFYLLHLNKYAHFIASRKRCFFLSLICFLLWLFFRFHILIRFELSI